MKTSPSDRRSSKEISLSSIRITDGLWSQRQRINAENAVFYQWEQLEKTGRLDNFRKAAGIQVWMNIHQ